MFTCVADLLKAYTCIHEKGERLFRVQTTATDGFTFQRAADIFSAKMPMNQPTFTETSYAFGVARVQLPGQIGCIGFNPGLMSDEIPTVVKGTPLRLIVYIREACLVPCLPLP